MADIDFPDYYQLAMGIWLFRNRDTTNFPNPVRLVAARWHILDNESLTLQALVYMTKIVILDRDGVINHDSAHYIKSPNEWRPIRGSLEAIAHLHHAGYTIVVATNQSGVARKLFTISTLDAIHEKMTSQISALGGHLGGIFYCPHLPNDGCNCRKPHTGLLSQISEHLDSDLQGVPFIGDSLCDIQAAEAFGCRPVLVKSGNGQRTLQRLAKPYPEIYTDLAAVAVALTR